MTLAARKELIGAVRSRYSEADRTGRKVILDEFTKITGYHRKHAIRILTGYATPGRQHACRVVVDEAVNEALVVLWEASDRICGKRLKAALPMFVDSMQKHGHIKLDESVRLKILAMSAATIDRRLRTIREHASGGRRKKSVVQNRIKKLVPVRTFADWGEVTPGFFEMDMVVHCGERNEGSVVHSLVMTDVASGWTECVALPVREQSLIVEAVEGVQTRLPFRLLGLDTDNDSAFLNDTLFDYCKDHGIQLTRSRPYQKNDQAWIEQKNGAVVRKLVGYGRLEGISATAALRRLYECTRLYTNFFQPSFKLIAKVRTGAHVRKTYDKPLTPASRLQRSEHLMQETKEKLSRQMERMDPVVLLKQIREAQNSLAAIAQKRPPEVTLPDLAPFVKNLAVAWKSGEIRPTHRREPAKQRWWRSRIDPFADVWPMLLGWLEEQPDMEAKTMLKRLQAGGYGTFANGQLRTLQRRVRVWRMQIVKQLVYGEEESAHVGETLV